MTPLPDDTTYAELMAVWPSLVRDIEDVDRMPDYVAEQVRDDFEQVADRLQHHIHLTRQSARHCRGDSGPEYNLVPRPE